MSSATLHPDDRPADGEDCRYSLVVEIAENQIMTLWTSDEYEDVDLIGQTYETYLNERAAAIGQEISYPMSIIDHFAHLADEN